MRNRSKENPKKTARTSAIKAIDFLKDFLQKTGKKSAHLFIAHRSERLATSYYTKEMRKWMACYKAFVL